MLIGATGYGLSNALEERFVRERPLYEVVGQLGFWGCIINAVQGAGIEHDMFREQVWNGKTIGLLIAYTFAMLSLYSLAPILFRLTSSPFYNLSIMTSNLFTLLFGLRLYGYRPYFLYVSRSRACLGIQRDVLGREANAAPRLTTVHRVRTHHVWLARILPRSNSRSDRHSSGCSWQAS